MTGEDDTAATERTRAQEDRAAADSPVCPVCGAPLLAEKCKLVCRSETCVYRIVFNCAEF